MLYIKRLVFYFCIFFVLNGIAKNKAKKDATDDFYLSLKVAKWKLNNGLTVLFHEDHSSPLIAYQTWFRVGSKDEEVNFSGIAHLFEHMMFKGTKTYSGHEFEQILQSNGITNNAFTSNDYTAYVETLPNDKLETIMKLESDRMVNLALTENTLKSEREVVKEERRMRTDNSPESIFRELIFANAFAESSYSWPIVGYMKDLDQISINKIKYFYKQFYAPNNAILLIVGDANKKNVKYLVNKYYAPLAHQKIIRPSFSIAPTIPNSQITLVKAVQDKTLVWFYRAPKSGEKDNYALDLMAIILGEGESSRLNKDLVYQQQKAFQVSVSNYNLLHSGLIRIRVTTPLNIRTEEIETVLDNHIKNLQTNKVSSQELQKAKMNIISDAVSAIKTLSGKAHSLALSELFFEDYTKFFTDISLYKKVTKDDILTVAKKYLTKENMRQAYLTPELIKAPIEENKQEKTK